MYSFAGGRSSLVARPPAFMPSISYASEYEFVAEGMITYEVLSFDGSPFVEQQDLFTVSVRGCEWHLNKTPIRFLKDGREQPLYQYSIVSSDSTNFYQVSSLKGILNKQKHQRETFEGRIGPGAVPFGLSDPKCLVLWYAFGSGCYFPALTNTQVNPPTVLKSQEMYAEDFRVAANWELEGRPPFLPRRILFYAPVSRQAKAEGYGGGHLTNCVFTVQESASQFGLTLPRVVTANYYGWHPLKPGTIIPTSRMRIAVTNYQARIALNSFRPDIPEAAVISDLRTIASNTPFGVAIRNGRTWPSIAESRKRAFARAQAIVAAEHRNTWRVTATRILLISVAAAPILWLTVRQLRLRNKNMKGKL